MIGREEEKSYLQGLLVEEEPQFIAVFGRRRIGKTYLIRESFKHQFTFQHTGISNIEIEAGSQKRAQLDKFASSLKEAGYIVDHPLASWDEAFDAVKEVIKRSKEVKKVIFIDELSWMDTRDSGLISALESFWNSFATARKEKDIILIVCASATYWMIDQIVNSRGGLHNRLTGQIYLKPFTLKECEQYLQSRNILLNRHQILQAYMILGGVPYYWSLLKKGKSLAQNIDELFFEDHSLLCNEYENLYRALFNHPEQYLAIVEALSSSNKGLSRDEIIHQAHINGSGNLSKKLIELENCGFIRRYIPYGYKTKNTLYQLIDNYTLFYHRFLKDKSTDFHFWSNRNEDAMIKAWSGLAFERVCLQHIPQIKKALGISGVYTEVNSWKCVADLDNGILGSQIDLLIVRKDQIINLCEMKYAESEFIPDANFDRSMRRKMSDFEKKSNTKYAIHPTLITTYGTITNSYTNNLQSIITADELFD